MWSTSTGRRRKGHPGLRIECSVVYSGLVRALVVSSRFHFHLVALHMSLWSSSLGSYVLPMQESRRRVGYRFRRLSPNVRPGVKALRCSCISLTHCTEVKFVYHLQARTPRLAKPYILLGNVAHKTGHSYPPRSPLPSLIFRPNKSDHPATRRRTNMDHR